MPIYEEARKKIEAITRKGDLLVLKIIIPIFIIPPMIHSYFQYYRMDYGKESFRIPFRASWVYLQAMSIRNAVSTVFAFFQISLWMANTCRLFHYYDHPNYANIFSWIEFYSRFDWIFSELFVSDQIYDRL